MMLLLKPCIDFVNRVLGSLSLCLVPENKINTSKWHSSGALIPSSRRDLGNQLEMPKGYTTMNKFLTGTQVVSCLLMIGRLG